MLLYIKEPSACVSNVELRGSRLGLCSCLSHDELSHMWELNIAPTLSLQDWSSLSRTSKDWYKAVATLHSSAKSQQLMKALTACMLTIMNRAKQNKSDAKTRGMLRDVEKLTSVTEHSGPETVLFRLWKLVSMLQRSMRLQPWGASLAAKPGLLQDFTQLFMVPCLPKEMAQYAIQHMDLRISYEQLLRLADINVADARIWVRMQHQLGVETDIPDIAVKVLFRTFDKPDLEEWQPADAEDLTSILQLAILADNHRAATLLAGKAISLMQSEASTTMNDTSCLAASLTQPQALVLLRTIVTCTAYGSKDFTSSMFETLGSLKVVQNVSAHDVLALFNVLWGHRRLSLDDMKGGFMIEWLFKLPAAPSSEIDMVIESAKLAVQQQDLRALSNICASPASARINVDTISAVHKLLSTASQIDSKVGRDMQKELCKLPAAWRLSPQQLLSLLLDVIKSNRTLESALCQLPAAATLTSGDVAKLLQAAERHQNHANVNLLRELQAASGTSSGD